VKVPLSLVVCPLAETIEDKETEVATVDFGEEGPMRCSKCKAYINPFMQFTDNGMRFNCNFCGNPGDGESGAREQANGMSRF
jgi:protein transport protein SEC24